MVEIESEQGNQTGISSIFRTVLNPGLLLQTSIRKLPSEVDEGNVSWEMGPTVPMAATIYDKIKHVITSNGKRIFTQINALLPTEEPEVVIEGWLLEGL